MTNAHRAELVLVLLASVATGFAAHATLLPSQLGMDRLILIAAGVLLGQGLVRDLYLLARNRGTADSKAARSARCMCVESTVGMLGIAIGLVLLALGIGASVALGTGHWVSLVGGTLLAGFLVKDYVLTWKPFGFKRDPDHMNIIVKF